MNEKSIIILYVSDQALSVNFYRKLFRTEPVLNVPGMTEFEIPRSNMLLGLMPESGIAKILNEKTVHPSKGSGIPRCELYLMVQNPDVDFENALNSGAREISRGEVRSWGAYVAYVSDPDGHIIAFAKNISV